MWRKETVGGSGAMTALPLVQSTPRHYRTRTSSFPFTADYHSPPRQARAAICNAIQGWRAFLRSAATG